MNYTNKNIEDEYERNNTDNNIIINSILDKGIEDFKNSQIMNSNSKYSDSQRNNNQNQINSNLNSSNTTNRSLALQKIMERINSTNKNKINEEESEYSTSNNQNKNSNYNIKKLNKNENENPEKSLNDMKNKLENLQSKIAGLDKRLNSSEYASSIASYNKNRKNLFSNKINKKIKRSKSKNSSRSNSKIRSYSEKCDRKYQSLYSTQNDIYKEKYQKLLNDFNNEKTDLIKLRQKTNQLKNVLGRLKKKEQLYDEVFDENNKMINNNELLFYRLEESEEVRMEQEKLIVSLKKEVDKLREIFNQ